MGEIGLEQKIVAVLAESCPTGLIDAVSSSIHQADVFKVRFDCLESQYQTNDTIERIRRELPSIPIMISIRHQESVPSERIEEEGFKPVKFRDKDYERIDLLRTATQECGIQYFEIEHAFRKGFILLGGKKASKSVILYANHNETPSLKKLLEIREEITKKGADYIVFETLVRNRYGDKGEEDKNTLLKFARESLALANYMPLTIVGRGKYGGDLNLEAYRARLSAFCYGVVPSFHVIPFLTRKRTYQEIPTLVEVNKALGLKRQKLKIN